MDALTLLLDTINRSDSSLVSPRPLAHSQELADQLPLVRRHVGPRAWYQCLEAGTVQPSERPPT